MIENGIERSKLHRKRRGL